MSDNVLAILALASLGTFLGLIIWRVPQVPLVVVIAVVLGFAMFDFWCELRRRRQGPGR